MSDPTGRSERQIHEHYEIEREIADKLRSASAGERRRMYSSIYEELFRRVPHHPQIFKKTSPAETRVSVRRQMEFLKPYLHSDISFLEIGAGSCALSFEVSRYVREVYALDVSESIGAGSTKPDNVRLLISDGCNIPVSEGSIDLAYSYQLMEHLHPDDAREQCTNVYRTLAPDGMYMCITPNRLYGPHDISQYFDREATGLHLKEYTVSELIDLFGGVGFKRMRAFIGIRGMHETFSTSVPVLLEKLLGPVPFHMRRAIASAPVIRTILGIRIIAYK
ncbi:MAG: class I SAM-dependent methyltransferase [bacterium]|nr:MAG: class I SAM-dependent methyltransferase [bacterium]